MKKEICSCDDFICYQLPTVIDARRCISKANMEKFITIINQPISQCQIDTKSQLNNIINEGN